MEYLAEIQTVDFPMFNASLHIQQVWTADQVLEFCNTHRRHKFAHFFSNKEEVVHYVLRLAGKAFTQFRVLCSNAYRAGVKVTLTHHDTTLNHQRCCRKAKLVCTQQGADHHVTASFHLAVNLQHYTATQLIQYQSLLCFRQAQFPWCTCMFHR